MNQVMENIYVENPILRPLTSVSNAIRLEEKNRGCFVIVVCSTAIFMVLNVRGSRCENLVGLSRVTAPQGKKLLLLTSWTQGP